MSRPRWSGYSRPYSRKPDTTVDDALSLPMVAFRGLWDKFAAPLTPEAICRSYSRGVPSLVRCADDADVPARSTILSSRRVSIEGFSRSCSSSTARRRSWSLTFRLTCRQTCSGDRRKRALRSHVSDLSGGLMARGPRSDRMSRSAAYLRGLTADDLAVDGEESLVVMFESVNVIDDVRLSPSPEGLNDDAVYASVRSLVGATAEVFRVSDLVELDWLQQRIREAA